MIYVLRDIVLICAWSNAVSLAIRNGYVTFFALFYASSYRSLVDAVQSATALRQRGVDSHSRESDGEDCWVLREAACLWVPYEK